MSEAWGMLGRSFVPFVTVCLCAVPTLGLVGHPDGPLGFPARVGGGSTGFGDSAPAGGREAPWKIRSEEGAGGALAVLRCLRGGGRPTKVVDKAKAQEVAIKGIRKGKARKRRYRAGTQGFVPFAGPRLYAVGGRSGKVDLATVHVYDAKAQKWEMGPSLELRRASPCAVGARGKVYVLGGTVGFTPLSDCRSLRSADAVAAPDPGPKGAEEGGEGAAGWAEEAEMPFARRCFAACADGGTIYVMGGAGQTVWGNRTRNDMSFRSVQSFDCDAGGWSNVTSLPGEVRHHAAACLGGRVYCVGGWRGNVGPGGYGCELDEVWSWAPGEEVWRAEPPLRAPRRSLQAVALGGRLYAVGGVFEGDQVPWVESLGPGEAVWREEPPMRSKRSAFSAAAFNGRIYAAGGVVGGAELRSVECFDPSDAGEGWVADASLPNERWSLALAAA